MCIIIIGANTNLRIDNIPILVKIATMQEFTNLFGLDYEESQFYNKLT